MTSTDLVYSSASLDQRKEYALAISRAGDLLPKGLMEEVTDDNGRTYTRPSAGKVLLIAETGNMLGIHPIAALNGVNVIEGKPTLSPALMSALVRRAGHKLRVTTKGTVEGGDFEATATLIRGDDPDNPYTSTWTPQRGARAGLCTYTHDSKAGRWVVKARSKYDKVLPWESYTEALCKARAIGEVCRDGAEDALMGVHYMPEELGATVNEAGEMVDLTATAIDRTYEQDEDGPNVAEAMRAESSNPDQEPLVSRKSGHASEREVVTRAVDERTPDAGKRPGRPRPAQAQAAGAADPAEQAAVAADWIGRITDTDTLDALYDLHKEAAARHVLEHTLSTGRSVEDVFLTRREELQNPPEVEQPILVPDYTDETPF